MDLRENSDINNSSIKKPKKSILSLQRNPYIKKIDIILLVVILAVLAAPAIKGLLTKEEVVINTDVNLYLSLQCEDFFGMEMTDTLIQEFEENNPGIKIFLADGEAEPDILIFNDGDFPMLVSKNTLVELGELANYDSGSLQFAIPLVSFMNLLFYNINILTEAGFDSPPKTREEFTAYSRTVSRGESGASGAALSLSRNDHLALSRDVFSWMWASGGDFWEDGESPSLRTRAAVGEITFLETLNREGSLAPDVFYTTGSQRVEQFAQGKVALMTASSQVIPYLREKMGDEAFGITTIPGSGTGGNYHTSLSSIHAAISAGCQNIEQAWSFLVFLTEKSSLFCDELKAVPGAVSNIIPGDYVRDDPFYSKAWEIFEASRIAEGFTGKPGAEEYETIFLEELQACFERTRTAAQTVNRIQQRWNEVRPPAEMD